MKKITDRDIPSRKDLPPAVIMLANFKNFVKEHESDIILTIAIILIALISFGAGLLIDFSENKEPIVIQNPSSTPNTNYSASIQQSLSIDKQTEQGMFVGSINSNKYHWPDCPWGQKISEENQIWFSSEEEAQAAGYVRCGNFDKYIPLEH